MYLCVCHAVTADEVEKAIADGASTREAVARRCGAGGDCGACHADIEQMIEEHRRRPCGNVPAARLGHGPARRRGNSDH